MNRSTQLIRDLSEWCMRDEFGVVETDMTRRDFLGMALGVGTAALLAACGGGIGVNFGARDPNRCRAPAHPLIVELAFSADAGLYAGLRIAIQAWASATNSPIAVGSGGDVVIVDGIPAGNGHVFTGFTYVNCGEDKKMTEAVTTVDYAMLFENADGWVRAGYFSSSVDMWSRLFTHELGHALLGVGNEGHTSDIPSTMNALLANTLPYIDPESMALLRKQIGAGWLSLFGV